MRKPSSRGIGMLTCFEAMVVLAISALPGVAADPDTPNDKDAAAAPEAVKRTETADTAEPRKYFQTKAWGSSNSPEPPGYVKTVDQFGVDGLEDMSWLEFGLRHQTRFELRDDSPRRPRLEDEEPFLLRSHGYVGVREILDPLRFGFEFLDARWFNNDFPDSNREVNEHDVLQAFIELYFADILGEGYPIRFQAGRMTFDYLDRRLVARNRFRNTLNAFDGFRIQFGQRAADWQVDFFATQPVDRRLRNFDHPDEETWFYGLIGAWRKWDKIITLEPYYFILDEDRKDRHADDREIHTFGLHVFGPIPETGFDYDVNAAYQIGEDGELSQRAFAYNAEIGHTFDIPWEPRLSFATSYASGERFPDDEFNERFDQLFSILNAQSMADLYVWENFISTRIGLQLKPLKNLSVLSGYSAYWLASDNDGWVITDRIDPRGRSGDFLGHELQAELRYQFHPRMYMDIGYSHFIPGEFMQQTGPGDDSDFFYVQTTLSF